MIYLKTIKRIYNKVSSLYGFFVKPRKVWKFPKNCEVVIYDNASVDDLLPFIGQHLVYILFNRGEEINLPCMMLLDGKTFLARKFEIAYENTIIRKIKPKLVITFIDNNRRFCNISRVQKGVKTVAIQNGWRYGWDRDVFSTFKTNQDLCGLYDGIW